MKEVSAASTLKHIVLALTDVNHKRSLVVVCIPGDRELEMKRAEIAFAGYEVETANEEDFAKKMGGLVNTFNQSIHLQTGQDLSKTIKTLYSGYDVNSGPGGFISFNGYFDKKHPHHNPNTFFTFDPNNEQSMVQAFRNYGSKLLQSTGGEYSPEQIQSIVDKAISSIGGTKEKAATQQAGGGVARKDKTIAKSIGPANKFSTFLQEYNKQYNSKAIA
jgi:hypothetical protein